MRIKPTWQKTYIITYKRGKEEQVTEVVEAKEAELHILISNTFKGRFASPKEKDVSLTKILVTEIDNEKRKGKTSFFSYTKDGKSIVHPHAFLRNMSPRAARIELEKAIKAT